MKKELKTELTKQKILLAATREFGEKGYSAASLNTVCDSGISKGLIYHNFKNKDTIYLACVSRCFSALTEYLREHCTKASPQEYMDARLLFFKQNEDMARLFFEALLLPPAHLKNEVEDLKKDFDEFNRSLYLDMLSTLSLRPDVTQNDAMEYFSMMQHMFNAYFSRPDFDSTPFSQRMLVHEASLSKVLDFMLYGIAQRKELL